jgi:hypothetical protein
MYVCMHVCMHVYVFADLLKRIVNFLMAMKKRKREMTNSLMPLESLFGVVLLISLLNRTKSYVGDVMAFVSRRSPT